MKNKGILTVFLLGITVFSIFKYVSSIKERSDLSNALNSVRAKASALENDKKTLLQEIAKHQESEGLLVDENSRLKNILTKNQDELAKLDAELSQSRENIEELNSQISVLDKDNTLLSDQRDNLRIGLLQSNQEKEALQLKLNSAAELKKAIKELKIKMRKQKLVARPVEIKIPSRKELPKMKKLMPGNRGYLIKDGKPAVYPAKFRIEVKPFSVY